MMLLGLTTSIRLMGKPCWNELAPVFYVNNLSPPAISLPSYCFVSTVISLIIGYHIFFFKYHVPGFVFN